jgi:signal transduction histidine kinase
MSDLLVDRGILETILHFLPYPFLLSESKNGDRHTIFINQKFQQEIGYHLDEISTIEDWFEIAYPDVTYRQQVNRKWHELALTAEERGSDHFMMKAIIQTRSHGQQWYEVKASVSGKIHLVAFVNIDDIIRKENELKIQHENKNRTLSILGHDLRAPLSNLLGLSTLAMNRQLSDFEFYEVVGEINRKSAQALELLDNTLGWVSSNFEEIRIKQESIRLKEIVDHVFALYEKPIAEKKLVIKSESLDILLTSDRDILTIILRNIISNAIKFTNDGGEINVSCEGYSDSCIITVADSGVGIPPLLLHRISTGDALSTTGTRMEKGLGIGLRFCNELTKKLSGDLVIHSSVGKGTKVKVTLKNCCES